MQEQIQKLSDNVDVITQITPGTKIYIHDNKMYLDDRYLQSIRRSWNGDGGLVTVEFLEKLINDYKLIKMQVSQYSYVYRVLLDSLVEKLNSPAVSLGLKNLLEMYTIKSQSDESYKEICVRLENITKDILKL